MRPLGLIPARGSSERFPRKNLALLGGKPLLVWTIEPAVLSGVFNAVWVSSEDEEILEVAGRHGGVPLARPADLAAHRVTVAEVCRHVLGQLTDRGERFPAVYILLPTSPFRTAESIRTAWNLFQSSGVDALMSVVPSQHPPQWCFVQVDGWLRPYVPGEFGKPRVDLVSTWRHDGAHQIVRSEVLLERGERFAERTLPFFVPVERAVDINNPLDLEWAAFLLARKRVSPVC